MIDPPLHCHPNFTTIPVFDHNDFITGTTKYIGTQIFNVKYEDAAYVRPRIPRVVAAFARFQLSNDAVVGF
jgi:hypothetical protein